MIKIRNRTVFTLLVLLILSIYSNTFNASFQLDDKPNIIDNTRLHITDLSPGSLWKTFFAKGGKDEFFRPLPSLSLALNWYVGKKSPFGYHIVNIAIHMLTAFFLYLTISALLKTRKIEAHYKENDVYFIALLSTVLWAVNPIQIQAVTYIVQRMASMAAMFYILGIYFYLTGRQSRSKKKQVLFFIACFFSFVSALMSKQNAIMMPASLFFVEIIFFQHVSIQKQIKNYLPSLVATGILLVLLGIAVFLSGTFDFLFKGYSSRPFTLSERLLTEPRIVLFYISQIFYPLPGRLSITHDIIISKSLLSPLTTLPAILTIVFLVGLGLSQIKKRPLVAFAILFFFLNHVIESTVIPLELIFEHRNYLPSLFIFLPIASGLTYLFNVYKTKNRFMVAVLATFMTLIIIGLGCFTYIRNRDWRTETSLWHDAMKKAPQDARPAWNLAIELAWDKNVQPLQLEVALVLFEKALSLNQSSRFYLDARIFRNMGIIYHHRNEYEKAIETFKKGLDIDPHFTEIHNNLIDSLIMLGKWTEALEQTERLIDNKDKNFYLDYYKLKGFILLWQKKPDEALTYLRKALKKEPNNRALLLNTGVTLSLMGENSSAEFFLKKANRAFMNDIKPVYALIENSIRAGDLQKTEKYVNQMFAQFSIQTIIDGIGIYADNYRTAPMSPGLIVPVVKQKLALLSEDFKILTPVKTLREGPSGENASKY